MTEKYFIFAKELCGEGPGKKENYAQVKKHLVCYKSKILDVYGLDVESSYNELNNALFDCFHGIWQKK